MHWGLCLGRHHEREERERAVLGAEEQPLPDAAAHAAVGVALLVALGQPGAIGKQRRERRPDRVARLARRSGLRDHGAHASDEVPDDGRVEQVLVAGHARSLGGRVSVA
jgi:hypothetical protein